MGSILEEIFAPRPFFDTDGVGPLNADALREARARPAFFDMSCLVYRMIYAKADDYVRRLGGDVHRISHAVASDVMCDVADACRNFACAPVLAFDSTRSIRAQAIYPEYKAGRGSSKKSANEETVLSCKNRILAFLYGVYAPGYKIQTFRVNGYESDDIIAALVLGLKQRDPVDGECAYDKSVVIVSSDHDLHQIVGDGVFFADVKTGVLCTAKEIEKHTGIGPQDVVAAKCVGGCASDNVGNVPGCGEKTVAEVLLKRTFDVSQRKAREALNSLIGEEILRRNLTLIRLPFEGDPPLPKLRLSAKVWPKPGVPENMAVTLNANGVPRSAWPSFSDITLPRPEGAIPMCSYKPNERKPT